MGLNARGRLQQTIIGWFQMSEIFSQTIVLGVGLLGGSLGLAAKKANVGGKIIGLGRNSTKLVRAVELGAIDDWATNWRDALSFAEPSPEMAPVQIVLAAPVEVNLKLLSEFWALRNEPWFAGRRYVVSDVGSVKGGFAESATKLLHSSDQPKNVRISFVPAHPIAGSDKSGVEHASSGLFYGKLTILTPWSKSSERSDALACGNAIPFEKAVDVKNDPSFDTIRKKFVLAFSEDEKIDDSEPSLSTKMSICVGGPQGEDVARVRAFWRALGSCVVETSAEEHDQILARTSHLPNLVSVLTTSVVPRNEFLFTGTGFRDVTRLAGGSPDVWTEIYLTNRVAVLEALQRLEENILCWKAFLQEGDRESILTFLNETKKKRDALGS